METATLTSVVAPRQNSHAAPSSNGEAAGDVGEDCLSGEHNRKRRRKTYSSREFRSRPLFRVAQSTPTVLSSGRRVGSPFLWLLSFGEAKESSLPPGNPRQICGHLEFLGATLSNGSTEPRPALDKCAGKSASPQQPDRQCRRLASAETRRSIQQCQVPARSFWHIPPRQNSTDKVLPLRNGVCVRWPRQTAWEFASSRPNVPAYRQRPRKPPGANRDLTLPCQPTFNTNFPKFSPLNNIANTSGKRSIPSSTCSLETSLPARIHCPISTAASLYRAA